MKLIQKNEAQGKFSTLSKIQGNNSCYNINIQVPLRDSPGSPTKSKWDSPRIFEPEASTCCTPPISVNATNFKECQCVNQVNTNEEFQHMRKQASFHNYIQSA